MLKLHFHCLHLVLDFLYFHSDSHLSQCLTQNDNCCDCLINLIMNLLLQCYWNEKRQRDSGELHINPARTISYRLPFDLSVGREH